ncbi:hypothetical protein ALT_3295 [Aspergillus lentulus]|uniref:Uncharacterized protein n=1 Tax=Aspergillus lentulus TaxID=293939 RepID=A0AAN4T9F6_ASPLE|nr:hypothetical protein ALT_3295 [Aspergillus lentulus]
MSSDPSKTGGLALESFPTTQPAIRIKAGLAGQLPCGEIYTGSTLVGVPLSHGTIESVEGFEPKLNFKISNGHDWFRIDADKKHGRLGITAIATDAEGRCLRVMADGVVELNEPTLALIMGHPEAKSTRFGSAVEQMRFECGHEPYKPLENMMFAGSMRFLKEESGELYADIRLSTIIAGSGYE